MVQLENVRPVFYDIQRTAATTSTYVIPTYNQSSVTYNSSSHYYVSPSGQDSPILSFNLSAVETVPKIISVE